MSLCDNSYDPFRRNDRYGTAWETPQPLSEKLLLVACRLCLLSLGFVRIRWEQVDPDSREAGAEPCVIVSNHCSWVDILVHMSRFFPAFVARDSTKNLMLIGLISKKMGCLFVDRERSTSKGAGNQNGKGVGNVVKQRIQKASRGEEEGARPMLLFPEGLGFTLNPRDSILVCTLCAEKQEGRGIVSPPSFLKELEKALCDARSVPRNALLLQGTTTNGQFLLPFRTGAFLAGCPVQPVILQYGQGRVSPTWESIHALQHVWLILCIPFHSVTATELPLYVPSSEEVANPQLFAANVRACMLKTVGLKPSRSTLAEKREFHSLLSGETPAVVKKTS